MTERKKALTEFNKKNILKAAKKLFTQKGFTQTTMDDIGKEADYSKSTMYVYFKSKDEIYNHLIYENMMLLKQGLEESLRLKDSFESCFYSVCETLAAYRDEYPLFFESLLGEISVKDEDFESQPILFEIYKVGEEINGIIENLLKQGINSKYLRADIDPIPTVFIIWSNICGVISIANTKEYYFQKQFNIDKQTFLKYGFRTILQSIINRGENRNENK